jgi:hypothetical protein
MQVSGSIMVPAFSSPASYFTLERRLTSRFEWAARRRPRIPSTLKCRAARGFRPWATHGMRPSGGGPTTGGARSHARDFAPGTPRQRVVDDAAALGDLDQLVEGGLVRSITTSCWRAEPADVGVSFTCFTVTIKSAMISPPSSAVAALEAETARDEADPVDRAARGDV